MDKATVDIVFVNTRARFRSKDRHVRDVVDKYLSYFSKTAPFHREYKRYLKDRELARREGRKPRGWNGVTHLLNKDDSFPAGLTPRVVDHLRGLGFEVNVTDKREVPDKHPKLVDGYITASSREWQDGAFAAIKQHERGVIKAATGTGKTTVMAQNIAYLGQTALVLVNRATLAKQTLARFQEIIKFPNATNPFGLIGDGIWEPGLITVATFQTLHSMLRSHPKEMREWLTQFHSFHGDECHHIPAETFADLINETSGCYYRYGYSATPMKGEKETEMKLVGATGEIIFDYSAAEAIADGILTPPRIYIVNPKFPALKKTDPLDDDRYRGNFVDEYKEGIVEHRERNFLISNLANILIEQKIPTLILVRQKKQGQALMRLIDHAEFIFGKDSTEVREDAKRRLASGELPVLIASTIFNEGEDIPAIGALIVGGGYKAEHVAMQTVGRALRKSEGKEFVLIFDVWDGHTYRLTKHSESRQRAWEDAGFEVQVVSLDTLEELMDKEDFFP